MGFLIQELCHGEDIVSTSSGGCPTDLSIIALDSGDCVLELEGDLYTNIRRRELVLIRANYQSTRIKEPIRGYYLRTEMNFIRDSFPASLFNPVSELLDDLTCPIVCIPIVKNDWSEAQLLLSRMLSTNCDDAGTFWTTIRLYLGQLLLLCYRNLHLDMPGSPNISDDSKKVINAICSYIDQHYTGPLNLKDIAQRSGYASTYVSALFGKTAGKGFVQYVNEKRIAHAQELLRCTNLKVIHICQEAGFEDLGHFYRIFKRSVGVSPTRYRDLFSHKSLRKSLSLDLVQNRLEGDEPSSDPAESTLVRRFCG
jgi:AraC-like DNA-binding protein